jgi:hypothetical protein
MDHLFLIICLGGALGLILVLIDMVWNGMN